MTVPSQYFLEHRGCRFDDWPTTFPDDPQPSYFLEYHGCRFGDWPTTFPDGPRPCSSTSLAKRESLVACLENPSFLSDLDPLTVPSSDIPELLPLLRGPASPPPDAWGQGTFQDALLCVKCSALVLS